MISRLRQWRHWVAVSKCGGRFDCVVVWGPMGVRKAVLCPHLFLDRVMAKERHPVISGQRWIVVIAGWSSHFLMVAEPLRGVFVVIETRNGESSPCSQDWCCGQLTSGQELRLLAIMMSMIISLLAVGIEWMSVDQGLVLADWNLGQLSSWNHDSLILKLTNLLMHRLGFVVVWLGRKTWQLPGDWRQRILMLDRSIGSSCGWSSRSCPWVGSIVSIAVLPILFLFFPKHRIISPFIPSVVFILLTSTFVLFLWVSWPLCAFCWVLVTLVSAMSVGPLPIVMRLPWIFITWSIVVILLVFVTIIGIFFFLQVILIRHHHGLGSSTVVL